MRIKCVLIFRQNFYRSVGTLSYVMIFWVSSLFFTPGSSILWAKEETVLSISSPNFQHEEMIPVDFTCQGKDISPALHISNIPSGTQTLALIVDDPDAPIGTWVHWVVYDILPKEDILRGEIPGIQGINDFKKLEYGGPCPPSGIHRYFFKLYALDSALGLKPGVKKKDLLKAMKGHILAQTELMGKYKQQ